MTRPNILLFFRAASLMIDTLIFSTIAELIIQFVYVGNSLGSRYSYMAIGFVLIVFRDIFGKSPGKIIFGLEIVDNQTGMKASAFKRILKNVTTPLTIIEGVILLVSKDTRRLGDRLAKTQTRIVDNNYIYRLITNWVK